MESVCDSIEQRAEGIEHNYPPLPKGKPSTLLPLAKGKPHHPPPLIRGIEGVTVWSETKVFPPLLRVRGGRGSYEILAE